MNTVCKAIVIVIGAVILMPITAIAGGESAGWHLVYAIDREGKSRGDKDRLIQAVRAGQPIRVGWGIDFSQRHGVNSGVEHVADAKFLTLFEGEVFAQVDAIARQRPRPGDKRIILWPEGMTKPWVAILDTSGHLRTPETTEEKDTRMQSFWYIRSESTDGSSYLSTPDSLR